MSYLLEEELARQGVFTKTTLKIEFNHKVYIRVKTLPLRFLERAKKIKEQYTAKKLDSLLIEHKSWIAIWVEELNRLNEIDNNYMYRVQDLSSPRKDVSLQSTKVEELSYLDDRDSFLLQDTETKPSFKKYRGVTYEDKLFDSSDSLTESQPLTRKYRGITYYNEVSEDMSDTSSDVAPLEQGKRRYRGRFY